MPLFIKKSELNKSINLLKDYIIDKARHMAYDGFISIIAEDGTTEDIGEKGLSLIDLYHKLEKLQNEINEE